MRQLVYILCVVGMLALLAACASIGRPEGGPRDLEPPVFVSARPAPGTTGVKSSRIELFFDENVQLEDAFNRVVVSPPQKTPPQVSANGRRIYVEMRDTLLDSTTYTIDFADAIKDLNEGNVLDGFAIDFATGPTIDTLRLSGMVFEARNLEPAQGMLVGVYSNLSDTAISTLPMQRIARTDQYGRFTVRNLPAGTYSVYALKDMNRDYRWDRSEDVGFCDSVFSPICTEIVVTDTLYAADRSDSIVTRQGVQYLPNDILISWFNHNYSPIYMKDAQRSSRRKIDVLMSGPTDSVARMTLVDHRLGSLPDSQWALPQVNATRDSISFWITDPDVLATDSLMVALHTRHTDSLDQIVWSTDTLRMFYREPKQSKDAKAKAENDSVPRVTFMTINAVTGASHHLYNPVIFSLSQPVSRIDSAGVHVSMMRDSVWEPLTSLRLEPDSLSPVLRRVMRHDWEPGVKYRVEIDSAAIVGIYGEPIKAYKHEFSVKPLEEYANLTVQLIGVKDSAVVELLDSGDRVKRTAQVEDGVATFRYVDPGTYYLRLFIDANGNGEWDTGNLTKRLQPEEVYYFAKKIQLRRNWDVEQSWDIYELPIDRQKPRELLKNKPKTKPGEKDRSNSGNDEEEEDEDDMWGDNRNRNRMGNRGTGSTRSARTGGKQQASPGMGSARPNQQGSALLPNRR